MNGAGNGCMEEEDGVISLRRTFLRGASSEVQTVLVEIEDDRTIVEASHALSDLDLLAHLFTIGGNVSLEEMLYFLEMQERQVSVDGRTYPYEQVARMVADGNRRKFLPGYRRATEEARHAGPVGADEEHMLPPVPVRSVKSVKEAVS